MTLERTPEAIADRENIYDCIEADNPAAALALDETCFQKMPNVLPINPRSAALGECKTPENLSPTKTIS